MKISFEKPIQVILHGLLTLVFCITLESLAQANSSLSIPCQLATGAISEKDLVIVKRPSAFGIVDAKKQASLKARLTKIEAIVPGDPVDQCLSSCGSFAFSSYLSLLHPGTPPISGGYIAGRVLQIRFRQLLYGKLYKVELGSHPHEIEQAVNDFGVLTEEQYPPIINANMELLATILTNMGRDYLAKLRRLDPGSDEHLTLFNEAIAAARESTQYVLGFYPKAAANGRAKNLFQRATEGMFSRLDGVNSLDELNRVARVFLSLGYPLVLSFDVGGMHASDGFYNVPVTKNEVLGSHSTVLVGLYKDEQGQFVYEVMNSYRNAQILYLSEGYMKRHMIDADFYTPERLFPVSLSILR